MTLAELISGKYNDVTPRYLGKHIGCGGKAFYQTSASMGWRFCDKCNASSLHGKTVEILSGA